MASEIEPEGIRGDASRVDPLRADHLNGPYYGLHPVPAGLSTTLATLGAEEARKELSEQSEHVLLSFNALFNAGVLINRIPPELLAYIFQFAQAIPWSASWTRLLTVCRHWFVVGATNPSLWCSLPVNGEVNLLRTGLARSKGCLFSVLAIRADSFTIAETMDLLKPHVHRLREAIFGLADREDGPALVEFMEEHAMPMLQTFRAIVPKTIFMPTEEVIRFSPERFPRLDDLALQSVQTPSSSAIFRQLKRLDISGWLGLMPSFTSHDLVEVLRSCVNLESLSLWNLLFNDVGFAPLASPADRVTLAKLDSVELDTYAPVMRHILNAVIFPPTAGMILRRVVAEDQPGTVAQEAIESIMPDDRASLPIIARINYAKVELLENEHQLTGTTVDMSRPDLSFFSRLRGRTLSLSTSMRGVPALDRPGPADLLDVLRGAPLEVLSFTVTHEHMVGAVDWRAVFAAFPALRELSLNAVVSGDSLSVVADGLNPDYAALPASGTVESDSNSEERAVPCPQLREVQLAGYAGEGLRFDAFVRCLERRRAVLGREKALERLAIKCQTQNANPGGWARNLREVLAPLVDSVDVEISSLDIVEVSF